MPEIEGTGDNWFISHQQEGYVEVLEVALPSNHRVRLEYVDCGQDVASKVLNEFEDKAEKWKAIPGFVVLKILNRFEDKAQKWEAVASFKIGDLDGIASLFSAATDKVMEDSTDRGWHPLRWLRRMVFGERRKEDGTIDDMFERVGFADGAGKVGEQDRRVVPADGGGGGGDREDSRAPSGDGNGAI